MKKIFIISAVLLVLVLIFLGVYNFAFKKEATNTQQKNSPVIAETKKPTAAPEIRIEKIKAISDGPVLGPVIDKKTEKVKYYDANNGTVWQTDSDGQNKQQLNSTKVLGIKSVLWSPDHSRVLTTMQKDEKTVFYMYDYVSQKSTLLKNGLDTVVWDGLGTKIYYKYYDAISKKRNLNIANPDGSAWQVIGDIEQKNIKISALPLTSLVSYWNYPSNTDETQLKLIGATGGEQKLLLSGRYGADYLWSPKGDKALVSSLVDKNSKSMTLGIVNTEGKYQDLNIPTFVSKCAWSDDDKTVYYALPGDILSGATMPNDYQENKFNTNDTFWKMDITTGEKERIVDPTEIKSKYDSSNLILSPTEDSLYFINKTDQKLYKVSL